MAGFAVKLGLFVGLVMLLGPGVFWRFIWRRPLPDRARAWLRSTAIVGGLLVIAASGASLYVALWEALGYVDRELFESYLWGSGHGRATLVRIGLVLALATAPEPSVGIAGDLVYGPIAVAILGTVSVVSHNAGIGGFGPIAADLTHLVAVTAWVAAVLGIAFVPGLRSDPEGFGRALGRVSAVGLVAIVALFGTGVYSATLHFGQPSYMVTTSYGWTLNVKILTVLIIVGIAARNRWHHLPRALRGDVTASFDRSLSFESLLLVAVIGLTAVLATLPPPH